MKKCIVKVTSANRTTFFACRKPCVVDALLAANDRFGYERIGLSAKALEAA